MLCAIVVAVDLCVIILTNFTNYCYGCFSNSTSHQIHPTKADLGTVCVCVLISVTTVQLKQVDTCIDTGN